MLDPFGNPIDMGDGSQITTYTEDLNVSLLGFKTVNSKQGIFKLDKLQILGEPGSSGIIKFASSVLDPQIFKKVFKKDFEPLTF